MISPETLRLGYKSPAARCAAWAPILSAACCLYDINNPLRVAHFLAQVGVESGRLRYVKEIWGPTPQQLRYEPGTTLARRLGNVRFGDGKRYMGRGLIQVTGRGGYVALRQSLRARGVLGVPDFEATPQELERPWWAAISAADYWKRKGLNELADAGDVVTITKRINGGLTMLAERQALLSTTLPAVFITGV